MRAPAHVSERRLDGSLPILCLAVLVAAVSCRKSDGSGSGAQGSASATPKVLTSASVTSATSAAPPAASSAEPASSASAAADASGTPPAAPASFDPKKYSWLAATDLKFPKPVDSLESRFPPPPGYTRVPVEAGSFAEWLRGLPLAAPNTPVTSFSGDTVYAGDDEYVAAVVAIDTGSQDLQQSPDVIIRLHAEWLWSKGEKDSISYTSATKLGMPLARWAKGQRLIPDGPNVFWAVKTKPMDLDYGEFRKYLDAVMAWANSTALARRAIHVEDPKDLRGGDFFLQDKAPGHVAVVLDIATKPSGERVALLGQALNPAQSVHVIRLGHATAWFSMRPPHPVITAHTREFGWNELRRLEKVAPEGAEDK